MSKHTPGPWYQHRETVQAPNGTLVATLANANGTCNANAALIAAAPELLAALEALNLAVCKAGYGNTGMPELTQAWAAIAKATGGEP
jgi:phosphoribosylcarboxyaminoimidazole (NCAIR) mutase